MIPLFASVELTENSNFLSLFSAQCCSSVRQTRYFRSNYSLPSFAFAAFLAGYFFRSLLFRTADPAWQCSVRVGYTRARGMYAGSHSGTCCTHYACSL